jgi:hypothetical protein
MVRYDDVLIFRSSMPRVFWELIVALELRDVLRFEPSLPPFASLPSRSPNDMAYAVLRGVTPPFSES